MQFKKGNLVFIEDLKEETSAGSNVTYFTAKALVIAESDGQYAGTVETLKISELIQKTSAYVHNGVHQREAHKLYTWPANLGDHQAWSESKRIFLMQHVMNFPIRMIKVADDHHLTWEFITPEQFKNTPPNIKSSPEFQHYLDNQQTYFFLRKEKNEPI